ncbi:SPJ_0845 family protein [Limosilactobacillus sp.]
MGLVTRRSQQLDKLFDQFAVDPKTKPLKKKPADEKTAEKKNEDKKK